MKSQNEKTCPYHRRNVQLHFRVTAQEKELIQNQMANLGTKNMEAYLRKMAIDGHVIHVDVSEVKELVRLLRITSNSLNQLTKIAHETGTFYGDDIEALRLSYDQLWTMAEEVMGALASV